MNVAIGKIGKSILFDNSKWGARGGDVEAPTFYENLFIKNPDKHFYILGASDYSRLDKRTKEHINKNNNVFDIFDQFSDFKKNEYHGIEDGERLTYMKKWMKERMPRLDAGLFFAGPTGTSNVLGHTYKITAPDELATPLLMLSRYVGPLFYFLNETKIPYGLILNDPRFFPAQMKDLFHRPKIILSQFDETIKHVSSESYTNPTKKIVEFIEAKYTRIETIFLINRDTQKQSVINDGYFDLFSSSIPEETTTRSKNFMIVCNEGRPSRYQDLKKYVLDYIEDVDIYGFWDERVIGNDKRFKGAKKFEELQKILPQVKYTFCIPIKKGWVTAKFWEMAHFGIIPFLHPDYDTQNHLKCPPFIRITSPDDLYKKIKFLESNPDAYNTLQENLTNMLKKEYYNGEFLNSLAVQTLNELTQ